MKYHSIYVDQARYATYIVEKYLDTATVKVSTKFIRPHFHLTWYSQNKMYLPVMNKLRSWLGNSTFTTELEFVHWFIYCLQEWTLVLQYKSLAKFSANPGKVHFANLYTVKLKSTLVDNKQVNEPMQAL